MPPLEQSEIDAATVIVAQIGAEPFNKALDESANARGAST